MTEAQATELLELQRRAVALLEQLARARPRRPVDRKLHPKRYAARALGIKRETLSRHIELGHIHTVPGPRGEAVTEAELQRLLEEGLPELAARRPGPRRRASSPRPAQSPKSAEQIRDEILALKVE